MGSYPCISKLLFVPLQSLTFHNSATNVAQPCGTETDMYLSHEMQVDAQNKELGHREASEVCEINSSFYTMNILLPNDSVYLVLRRMVWLYLLFL